MQEIHACIKVWRETAKDFGAAIQVYLEDGLHEIDTIIADLRLFYKTRRAMPQVDSIDALIASLDHDDHVLEESIQNPSFQCQYKQHILWKLSLMKTLWPLQKYTAALITFFDFWQRHAIQDVAKKIRDYPQTIIFMTRACREMAHIQSVLQIGIKKFASQPHTSKTPDHSFKHFDQLQNSCFHQIAMLLSIWIDAQACHVLKSTPEKCLVQASLHHLLMQPKSGYHWLKKHITHPKESLMATFSQDQKWPIWLVLCLVIVGLSGLALLSYGTIMIHLVRGSHKKGYVAIAVLAVMVMLAVIIGVCYWRMQRRQILRAEHRTIYDDIKAVSSGKRYHANLTHVMHTLQTPPKVPSCKRITVQPHGWDIAPQSYGYPCLQQPKKIEKMTTFNANRWLLCGADSVTLK